MIPSARIENPRVIFGIDLRTLALFRILLGSYILLDLALRARDLSAHYTDFGVMPRDVQGAMLADGSWSLHFFNGTPIGQATLFCLAGLAAIGLIAGWRARLMTIVCWVMLVSIQNRNTFILSGEDNLAVLLTFWAMFLPLGARYSVDCALDRTRKKEGQNAYWSWATTALLLQGMSMYLFSALLKSDPIWVPDGTAVYYALNLDYLVTSLAVWFRQFETLLTGLTYYVWVLELVGPFLIFTPIFQKPVRVIVMVLFITMHLGFFLFLEIGLFPLICIIMNLTFMPGWVWDKLGQMWDINKRTNLQIWYDEDCGFCLKMCHLIKTFFILPGAEIKPAQQDAVMGELLLADNSWIVTKGEIQEQKWAAFALLLKASPIFSHFNKPAQWGWVTRMGNWLYDLVATHRSAISAITSRVFPWRSQTIKQNGLTSIMVIGLFAFVTVQNLSTLPKLGIKLPYSFIQLRQALSLYQNWTMFAPYPELDSPRPMVIGSLRDGTAVDVYHGRLDTDQAVWKGHAANDYENYRWRKFLSNLEDESYRNGHQVLAKNYARYLCRQWKTSLPNVSDLSTLTIKFNVKRTKPPGGIPQFRVNTVWFHNCSK